MSAALVVAEWEALVVIQVIPEGLQAAPVLHSAICRGLEAAGLGCRVCRLVSTHVHSLWSSASVEG